MDKAVDKAVGMGDGVKMMVGAIVQNAGRQRSLGLPPGSAVSGGSGGSGDSGDSVEAAPASFLHGHPADCGSAPLEYGADNVCEVLLPVANVLDKEAAAKFVEAEAASRKKSAAKASADKLGENGYVVGVLEELAAEEMVPVASSSTPTDVNSLFALCKNVVVDGTEKTRLLQEVSGKEALLSELHSDLSDARRECGLWFTKKERVVDMLGKVLADFCSDTTKLRAKWVLERMYCISANVDAVCGLLGCQHQDANAAVEATKKELSELNDYIHRTESTAMPSPTPATVALLNEKLADENFASETKSFVVRRSFLDCFALFLNETREQLTKAGATQEEKDAALLERTSIFIAQRCGLGGKSTIVNYFCKHFAGIKINWSSTTSHQTMLRDIVIQVREHAKRLVFKAGSKEDESEEDESEEDESEEDESEEEGGEETVEMNKASAVFEWEKLFPGIRPLIFIDLPNKTPLTADLAKDIEAKLKNSFHVNTHKAEIGGAVEWGEVSPLIVITSNNLLSPEFAEQSTAGRIAAYTLFRSFYLFPDKSIQGMLEDVAAEQDKKAEEHERASLGGASSSSSGGIANKEEFLREWDAGKRLPTDYKIVGWSCNNKVVTIERICGVYKKFDMNVMSKSSATLQHKVDTRYSASSSDYIPMKKK